jgi:hypothetical protein
MQVWNALPLTCRYPKEKGAGIRSMTELYPSGEEEKCLDADKLRGRRGYTTSGMQEEDVVDVPTASRPSSVIR